MSQAIVALGHRAADYATTAALAYLEQEKALTLTNCDKLADALKRRCAIALPVALEDAKEAIAAGLADYAPMTFAASMKIAGIAAAKEVLGLI